MPAGLGSLRAELRASVTSMGLRRSPDLDGLLRDEKPASLAPEANHSDPRAKGT